MMGTPDTARQQWLSRGACNSLSRHRQSAGRMHFVSWRICRDDSGIASKADPYFQSVNYTVDARRPRTHGPFRHWRRGHDWACMLEVVYLYPDITREEVHAHVRGGVDLRELRKRSFPAAICQHLSSNSDEVLRLSASSNNGPSTSQCMDCDTTFTLRANNGSLYLLIHRDLERLDVQDVLKNPKWLSQVAPSESFAKAASMSGAVLNPSRYEATRQGMSQAVTQVLNRA